MLAADPEKRAAHLEALASAANVTKQAVHGWIRTGRIAKRNLQIASAYFGSTPSFGGAGLQAQERGAHGTASSLAAQTSAPNFWPFPGVSAERVMRLSEPQRERLSGALLLAAGQMGVNIASSKRAAA